MPQQNKSTAIERRDNTNMMLSHLVAALHACRVGFMEAGKPKRIP